MSAPTRIVILGALSAVAIATARRFAAEGASFALAARRPGELSLLAGDLAARGAAQAEAFELDLAAADPGAELERMAAALGGVDIVLLAYGSLTDQARATTDLAYAASELRRNFLSAALWSLAAAKLLAAQRSGVLVVIGSVAGDRGRQSNFVYGGAKAGLGTLVQGIAHQLSGSGARAVLIKPGFIDTPMTAHLPKRGPLWSKPETIAAAIHRAALSGGPVRYAPAYWRLILLLIRMTPAAIFHRTKL